MKQMRPTSAGNHQADSEFNMALEVPDDVIIGVCFFI